MGNGLIVENPKLGRGEKRGSFGWFDYYAGFSSRFATSIIESAELELDSVIVDPWNGSGTTTAAASLLGFKNYGYDLNPVMVVIARAKMINRREVSSLLPLTARIIKMSRTRLPKQTHHQDSLSFWLADSAISNCRKVEQSIQKLLVDENDYKPLVERDIAKDVSFIAAFFYNAIFRTVRKLLTPFLSSNPTWVKKAKRDSDRISVDLEVILTTFESEVKDMVEAIENDSYCSLQKNDSTLEVASSINLPLEDGLADMIVTSPPYCTRIDYAVATMPELAMLGYSQANLRSLRQNMIGTSTVPKNTLKPQQSWGKTCNSFLKKVKGHKSKASATYYYKNHLQYYDALSKSLLEMNRILKPGGVSAMVVQDSFYKDVHNDLPLILEEMMELQGFKLQSRIDFDHRKTFAGLNPAIKPYRTDFKTTESVICFQKNEVTPKYDK